MRFNIPYQKIDLHEVVKNVTNKVNMARKEMLFLR